MSQPGSDAPSPFSREGSSPDDALGQPRTTPDPTRPEQNLPGHPPIGPGAAYPTAPATPSREPEWPSYPEPTGRSPVPPAPAADPLLAYPAAADPTNPYAPSPYAASPYAPSLYGSPSAAVPYPGYRLGSPYGVAPQHPQAVTALVLGIVGVVVCQPVGIGGVIVGLRVRRDSDAQPGQFTGRGLGTAGLVLGIVSIVVMVFWIVVFGNVIAADN